MDSIKKKMQSLAKETANAQARAEKWEKEMEDTNRTADHFEEQVRVLQKKIQAAESQFDVCTEDLFNQTIKMEEMEKKAGNAEGQVGDLARRLLLLEENAVKSEERLAGAVTNLATASLTADRSIKDQHELSQVCTVLYCTVLYCTVLYCKYCSVLCCTVLYCTVPFCALLYVLFCAVLYCTVRTVLCCNVLYCTVPGVRQEGGEHRPAGAAAEGRPVQPDGVREQIRDHGQETEDHGVGAREVSWSKTKTFYLFHSCRATQRAEDVEFKFVDIEDELKLVGQNQQTLEVSEEQSLEREDKLQKQIRELKSKLKTTNTRAENAEMDIGRLNVRIDKVEEDLVIEKSKIKQVSDDLSSIFDSMMQGEC